MAHTQQSGLRTMRGGIAVLFQGYMDKQKCSTNALATVKVFVQDDSVTSPVLNEINHVHALRSSPRNHAGASVARVPYDTFQVASSTGYHHCLASEPHGCSLWSLRRMFPDSRLPPEFVKVAVRYLLACINWLFLECDIIHTGERFLH